VSERPFGDEPTQPGGTPGGGPTYQPYPPPGGYPAPQPEPYPAGALYQAPQPTNGLAIASMVTGIVCVAAAFALCGVGGILGIVPAIMGHVARGQIRRDNQAGDGFALAGVIIGWISFVVALIAIVVFVVILGAMFSPFYDSPGSGGRGVSV